MCGVFYIDDTTVSDISRLTGEPVFMKSGCKTGDIHPSERSVIITAGTAVIHGRNAGIPGQSGNRDSGDCDFGNGALKNSDFNNKTFKNRAYGHSLMHQVMKWGFPSYDQKQLLINARAESALAKKSFSESVLKRRCIVPAAHFYEWDRDKNKVTFDWKESPVLYMAGFYKYFEDEARFVILTTAANDSMKKVHDRMPLIFPEDKIREWIYDEEKAADFLKMSSPMLSHVQEYEQLTLW